MSLQITSAKLAISSATKVATLGAWYVVVSDGRKRGYYDLRPTRS